MHGGRTIWRALDRARAANLEAAGEAPPSRASDGISRRRLLGAMAAGAAMTGLPSCFRDGRRRIAVVGGGLAGLAALSRLVAAGADAELFEARAAVGGRTRTARGVFADGYAFDEGAQLVNSDHHDVLELVRELGLSLIDRRAIGHAEEIQIGTDGPVPERLLARDLRAVAARITADADRLDADYEAVAAEIDRMSVKDYLDRHGLAPGDARNALEAGIRTEYGVEPDHASALELLFNLPTVDGERVSRLSLSDERFLIDGGTGQMAQMLGGRLAPHIRLNRRLAAVTIGENDVRLTFTTGESRVCDRVILALPAPLLREVAIEGPLPPLWRELIAEVNLGSNEKLIAGYDRQGWYRTMGAAGALWSADGFSGAWDAASRPAGSDNAPGAITYFLGGGQVGSAAGASAGDLAKRFTAIAGKAIPGMPDPNARIRRTRWCDDPLTRGAYVNFRPGQLTRFGSLLTLEEEGRMRPSRAGPLLFAGEWLSDAWPGYMNGALQTGRIAAEAALAADVPAWSPYGLMC